MVSYSEMELKFPQLCAETKKEFLRPSRVKLLPKQKNLHEQVYRH